MNIREIIANYRNGNSVEKLAIISSVITIITGFIAIITSQIFTIKFVFDDTTFIRIAFYIIAMGASLLLIYIFLALSSLIRRTSPSFLLTISFIFMALGIVVLGLFTLWSLVLSIQ